MLGCRLYCLLILWVLYDPPAGAADDLFGQVMCGYQGWFRVPGDGSDCGWHHYSSGGSFSPETCHIDLWPDVSELPAADRFDTVFQLPDGNPAQVFSSVRQSTVDLHFRWMKQYGIDGVFLQRFAVTTRNQRFRRSMDAVLGHVQAASRRETRHWVLMYDLSGLKSGQADVVIRDWQRLKQTHKVADPQNDLQYQQHRGKPLIALWGMGFSDRDPMLEDWRTLIAFFRNEGLSVMAGVPTFWRTLDRDALADPQLHQLIGALDVVSPWTVGRYVSPESAARYAEQTLAEDLVWCRDRNVDFLPVVFPGFSWQNLSRTRGKEAPLDAIPRHGGDFLWAQCREFHNAGARMLYVAMFDELDEATAIMKCSRQVPAGPVQFVTETDVPKDQYLWLTGKAAEMLRSGAVVESPELPRR